MAEPITPQDVEDFVVTAMTGDTLVYHRGYLAADRADMTTCRPKTQQQKHVNLLGDLAWAHRARGEVALVQKRHGPRDYEYRMQRLPPRRMPRLSDSRLSRALQTA